MNTVEGTIKDIFWSDEACTIKFELREPCVPAVELVHGMELTSRHTGYSAWVNSSKTVRDVTVFPTKLVVLYQLDYHNGNFSGWKTKEDILADYYLDLEE